MLGSNSSLWSSSNGFKGGFSTFLLDAEGSSIANQKGVSPSTLSASNILGVFNSLSASLINQDLAAIMGGFGYDSAKHTAWAVIDHNSLFGTGRLTVTPGLTEAALADAPAVADLSVFNSAPTVIQTVPEPG